MTRHQHPGDYAVFLAYDTFEPSEGADHTLSPVFFLHGMSATKKSWADIPQRIAEGTKRKVYVLDARNHGDSDWTCEFSFDMITKDVDNFMDRHSVRRAVFVGHSMGGIASIKLALTKPERVEKLVVEDMMVRKIPQESVDSVSHIMRCLQKSLDLIPAAATDEEALEVIDGYLQIHTPPNTLPAAKSSRRRFLSIEKDSSGRFSFNANMEVLLKTLSEYEEVTKEPSGRYDGKAFFIYGSHSPFEIGNEINNIKTHFPNAEFLRVEDATHFVHADKPDEFTEALLKFILS